VTEKYLYVVVYLLVCVVGHFLVASCLYVMRRLVGLKKLPPFTEWLNFLMGGTERGVALTLYLLAPPYLPTFIGGWILLKFAVGWQRRAKEPGIDGDFVEQSAMLALIGNVLSFAIAIAGGWYIQSGQPRAF
jgi:hypothetical protein